MVIFKIQDTKTGLWAGERCRFNSKGKTWGRRVDLLNHLTCLGVKLWTSKYKNSIVRHVTLDFDNNQAGFVEPVSVELFVIMWAGKESTVYKDLVKHLLEQSSK